jgi:predicted TIM-barrel fold metal-dependent hydrolase
MKIVDSHQHVLWHHRNAQGLIDDLDEHGITYAWLLSWLPDPGNAQARAFALNPMNVRLDGSQDGITLRDIVETREKWPDRFVVGYCPNPRWSEAPDMLRSAYHMHGARVCGEWKFHMLFDDPRCLEVFRVAGELKMPVVLHLDVPYLKNREGEFEYFEGWFGGTIDNLERAMQACPETIFIGHAPGFWREISADAAECTDMYPSGEVVMTGRLYRLFETYPNLYADLSAGSGMTALKRDPGHALPFIRKFSDRLLFGRDYYGGDLLAFLGSLDLEEDIKEKLYWKNAESLVSAP